MIAITKERALAIQTAQVEHYAGLYGDQVREIVAAATTADQLRHDVAYDIATINRHIPRGGFIEALIDKASLELKPEHVIDRSRAAEEGEL